MLDNQPHFYNTTEGLLVLGEKLGNKIINIRATAERLKDGSFSCIVGGCYYKNVPSKELAVDYIRKTLNIGEMLW